MGFRLKITLRSERKFVVLTNRPVTRWCEACGAESQFADEELEASTLRRLNPKAGEAHRTEIDGRSFLCLRSILPTA